LKKLPTAEFVIQFFRFFKKIDKFHKIPVTPGVIHGLILQKVAEPHPGLLLNSQVVSTTGEEKVRTRCDSTVPVEVEGRVGVTRTIRYRVQAQSTLPFFTRLAQINSRIILFFSGCVLGCDYYNYRQLLPF
jgi:hypothetical protein